MNDSTATQLSNELAIPEKGVAAVLKLLDEGNTIPFISRYRKEMTGSLDEVKVREIKERSEYLSALMDRRKAILDSIDSQGKLTDELKEKITTCRSKSELEDLYLPYKPKRRTKATIAREKGLEPLAKLIMEQALTQTPEASAADYLNTEKGLLQISDALEGARHIAAEWISEDAAIRDDI